MEALQRLEGVQRMVGLMHNHSIFGPDAASDRFLAEFLLFMVQACTDEHEMAGRCNLLADQLPKMPATLLEEALCCKAKQDDKELQYRATNKGNKDTTSSFFPSLARYTVEGMPLVGLDAIERAKSTLEDFVSAGHILCSMMWRCIYWDHGSNIFQFSHLLKATYISWMR